MDLEKIKGLGPSTIKKLNKLNIYNSDDLLTFYPYKYNVYVPNKLNDQNDILNINATIISDPKVYFIRKNFTRLTFTALVENIPITVVIFNRHFLKQHLTHNKQICLIGKYNKLKNTFTANDILLNPLTNEMIEPKYHLTEKLNNSQIHKIIVENIDKENLSILPKEYIEKYQLIESEVALKYIHNPKNQDEIKQAKIRIIYEELFNYMFKINYLKQKRNQENNSIIKSFDKEKLNTLINTLPFELTTDQKTSLNDIINDLESPKRMNRLILGDVGSGKTIVAFLALYINKLAGYQGAFMAPTEVLAEQHFKEAQKILSNLKIELLTGSTDKKKKKDVLEGLKFGSVDIVIGTHTLIEDTIEFNNLGLVITDEQHRFGVNQRKALQNKGKLVDVIYMSATPIPRTLALTIFKDMEISEIKSKPTGRKEIITKKYRLKEIKEVLYLCLNEIKKGHQIYVVAPLIEGKNETYSVNELYKKFNEAYQGKIKIETLYGKKSSKEKNEIIQNFKNNETKILISTTVIEVGIDVQNATAIVIFNAERFGLATLHQLRGRVGRNDLQSYCYLISDSNTERLEVLESSNDGFYISEKDFEMRGSGDIFGTIQSGEQIFKLANLKRDYKILLAASKDSEEFIEKNIIDNFQKFPEYQAIKKNLTFID